MRICLLSREYPPDTGWGGIGAYTYQHAHGLKRLGLDVEVVALAKKELKAETELPPVETEGIKVHRAIWGPLLEDLSSICLISPYSHYLLKCSLALWQKFLRRHREQPFDIVEAPEHLAEGLFPALTRICPLVVRLHTPHSKFVQEGYHNLVPSFDLHMVSNLERTAMLEADVLSSPSVDLARYVAKDCGYDLDKIEIVRNPVDADVFNPEGARAIAAEETSPIVFFAGRLEERKGIYHLVTAIPEILKHCPQARFVFVGADTNTAPGEGSVLKELQGMLHASNSLASANFVGKVPLSEMANYYRSADICVVPSLYDNAPYTVLEAMACGKPIVGSSAGGVPEYINHEETGLVVPTGNAEELAKAITKLLTDKETRIAYGIKARQRIMNSFERSLIAQQAVKTYELAIQRHNISSQNALYRKPPELAVQDFVTMLIAYHESLSELIYKHSAGLNRQRWQQLVMHRPKLAVAKLVLGIFKASTKVPVIGKPAEGMARKLEADVETKEREAQEKMLERLLLFFDLPRKAES